MEFSLRPQGSGAIPGGLESVTMKGGVLTVGRGAENDLVLPDPDRVISKRHCVIEDRGGDYVLIDTSTNGTFLNFSPTRIGDAPAPLSDGDVIGLGGYELVVAIVDPMAFTPGAGPEIAEPLPADPLIAGGPRAATGFVASLDDVGADGDDFLDALLSPGAAPPKPGHRKDPFEREDPLGAGPVIPADDDFLLAPGPDMERDAGASDHEHTPSASDYFSAPAASSSLIPDDWDAEFGGGPAAASPPAEAPRAAPPSARPAAPPAPAPMRPAPPATPAAAPPPAAGTHDDPFADILGGSDFLAPDPAGDAPAPSEPAPAHPIPDDLDFDDPLGAAPEAPAAAPAFRAPPPMPPTTPPAARPDAPARPAPRPEPQPPAAAPAPPPGPAGAERAARAFLEAVGAGDVAIPDAELEETMARMGRVMRAMIEGIREVLMTRASIKSEFRMAQTTIRAGGNNPLKFSISPEQAVETMIRPKMKGYLDAEKAAAEALDDIKAHEVAMMTGMEAALKGLLGRLDPAELTAKIEDGGGFGGLLGGKKARYWEVYEKMYKQISQEAEDDFHEVFGREFARAYEEQQRKL